MRGLIGRRQGRLRSAAAAAVMLVITIAACGQDRPIDLTNRSPATSSPTESPAATSTAEEPSADGTATPDGTDGPIGPGAAGCGPSSSPPGVGRHSDM